MSTDYIPLTTINMADLFDGRLERFNIRDSESEDVVALNQGPSGSTQISRQRIEHQHVVDTAQQSDPHGEERLETSEKHLTFK